MRSKRILGAALCLCLALGAAAGEASSAASGLPVELHLAAAGLMIDAPAGLDTLEGDEEAYDLGFRYDGYSDTFDFTLYVQDSRDMSAADYAAFYAERADFDAVTAETVNGFPVWRLTRSGDPTTFDVLIADPNADAPPAVYVLMFSCTGEADTQLAAEILSTLAPY
jgi:hypothetical protein